jgi:hypothetical protein
MPRGPNDSAPVQPLSVGNVVSAAFQLYQEHAKEYLQIALYATLWVLLPFLVAIAGVAVFLGIQNYALLGLLIPALFVLFVYCLTKYLANSALIVRLAFRELTNQPESLADARRFISPRQWQFLVIALLLFLLFTGIMLVVYLGAFILVILILGALGGLQLFLDFSPERLVANPGLLAIGILAILLTFVLVLGLLYWLMVRFTISEVPLAVEPGLTARKSIRRSWDLTKGSVGRIFLILFVTFCVTIPLQILVQILSSVVEGGIGAVVPPESAAYAGLVFLVSYALSLALSVVVLPLWQIIKALIYFDLQTRREGLGLELRDRGPAQP